MTDIEKLPISTTSRPAAAAGTISIGGDMTVNRMGFGAMRLTGRGIWGPPDDRDECIRTLRRAVEMGVDFIDTAESYGPHVSEELIAEALYPYPPGLVIATKGGYDRPGPRKWVVNCRPDDLRGWLHGSLKRLRLERIDLWQLHRVDENVPEDEQFGVLAEFVRAGLVRHVGLSEVGVGVIERARKIVPVVSIQNRYNVIDRRWEGVVEYCEQNGTAFIPWAPLGSGSVARRDSEKHEAIDRVARGHEASPAQVALAWLLERSPAMLVIPGTSKVRHVEENIAAATLDLSDEDHEVLGY